MTFKFSYRVLLLRDILVDFFVFEFVIGSPLARTVSVCRLLVQRLYLHFLISLVYSLCCWRVLYNLYSNCCSKKFHLLSQLPYDLRLFLASFSSVSCIVSFYPVVKLTRKSIYTYNSRGFTLACEQVPISTRDCILEKFISINGWRTTCSS